MAQLKSNVINGVIVLTAIVFFASIALASVYNITKNSIQKSQLTGKMSIIREVLPPFDHLDKKAIVEFQGTEYTRVFNACDDANRFVGAAVESSSDNGFNGRIVVMTGFDTSGNIVNYKVINQKESPGFGAKMPDWFKSAIGKQSIIGKNVATANLTVTKDGGDVDAITGATITSRAFLFAVRNAYFAFEKFNAGIAEKQTEKKTVKHSIATQKGGQNDK